MTEPTTATELTPAQQIAHHLRTHQWYNNPKFPNLHEPSAHGTHEGVGFTTDCAICTKKIDVIALVAADAVRDRLMPDGGTTSVECDIDWTDLRSSRPGADVQAKSYVWPPDEFDELLAKEIRAADLFHRAPVRIRKRTVSTFPDGSTLVTAWVRVELPA